MGEIESERLARIYRELDALEQQLAQIRDPLQSENLKRRLLRLHREASLLEEEIEPTAEAGPVEDNDLAQARQADFGGKPPPPPMPAPSPQQASKKPGYYPDPFTSGGRERFWDGEGWKDSTHPLGGPTLADAGGSRESNPPSEVRKPGYYSDPLTQGRYERFWDGEHWGDATHPSGGPPARGNSRGESSSGPPPLQNNDQLATDNAAADVDGSEDRQGQSDQLPPHVGWWPDPYGEADERWWDGTAWTDRTETDGVFSSPRSETPQRTNTRQGRSTSQKSTSPIKVVAIVTGLLAAIWLADAVFSEDGDLRERAEQNGSGSGQDSPEPAPSGTYRASFDELQPGPGTTWNAAGIIVHDGAGPSRFRLQISCTWVDPSGANSPVPAGRTTAQVRADPGVTTRWTANFTPGGGFELGSSRQLFCDLTDVQAVN